MGASSIRPEAKPRRSSPDKPDFSGGAILARCEDRKLLGFGLASAPQFLDFGRRNGTQNANPPLMKHRVFRWGFTMRTTIAVALAPGFDRREARWL